MSENCFDPHIQAVGRFSYANTRQLAGYATLVQTWIYKHFPSINVRCVWTDYGKDDPWCMR